MGETADRHIATIKREVCRYAVAECGHGAHKPKFPPPDSRLREASEAAIRAAFDRAEEAEVLDKAVTALIAWALETWICPHEDCPHEPLVWGERPDNTVCQECFRDWALAQAKEANADGQ